MSGHGIAGVKPILDMNRFDPASAADAAVARRLGNLGALSVLFYRQPIEMASARGAWMVAADGRRYLDFYNNVPSVGHCHPKVVEAVARQMALLNTNTRYVVPIVDAYMEALKATLPADLCNVVLSCSGSEANDLALRVARSVTGGTGFVVTEAAYHGNTALVTEVSPSALRRAGLPAHVVAVPAPAGGGDAFAADVAGAFGELRRRGVAPAALVFDSIFSSDGIFAEPAGFLAGAVEAARREGALVIADEVQPGFGRTGDAFWGFARHGIAPDIVTTGKPTGNGFPMATMATRPEFLRRFAEDVGYFNTFGGNPVAAAAGLAVLEVMAEEGLQENARRVGAFLQAGLREIARGDARIADVRGAGLFVGVDLCVGGDASRPDAAGVVELMNAMRARGVLIGAAGKDGATFKLRPPLCLTQAEAGVFLEAFAGALGEVG